MPRYERLCCAAVRQESAEHREDAADITGEGVNLRCPDLKRLSLGWCKTSAKGATQDSQDGVDDQI